MAIRKSASQVKRQKRPAYVAQYQNVLDARQEKFNTFFDVEGWRALHEAAHVRLLEVERLLGEIKDRREGRLFLLALQLLADGLCSIASANYQLAFYSLRSFLEFATAAIKFSAFEFELRHWELGAQDIVWASISVGEKGVYSKSFAAAFFSPLAEEHKHYSGLAGRAYREASEYVHGNPSAHAKSDHEDERVAQWFSLFDASVTCVMYGFFVRYNAEVDLSEDTNAEVAALIRAELGHFAGVSAAISKASE